ncbi:MAG: transcriptional repressor [Cytophagales bacterium]|nr:transcriptional repressor [Cytophagales bacterium]MDW8383181.1 transcriptional repressor [Flammeovirgaceae bacterium]
MDQFTADELLQKYQLRQTFIRKEILEIFLSKNYALSHRDLEQILPQGTDRVTIYRTLKVFEQVGLIHRVPDYAGVERYAICRHEPLKHIHSDNHVHFYCECCSKTYCIEGVQISDPVMPNGFITREYRYLASGICAFCSKPTKL